MRVGICINSLQDMTGSENENGGIGVYCEQLIHGLLGMDSCNSYILIRDRPLLGHVTDNPRVKEVYFPYAMAYYPLRILGLWREWVVRHEKLDLVHETMSNASPLRWNSYPLVFTIHDLIPWLYPETCQRWSARIHESFMPANLRRAAALITTSENTCRDLIAYEPRVKDKIKIVPIAPQPLNFSDSESSIRTALQISDPYVLAVSTLEPRKNLQALLDAFVLLKDRQLNLQLVLVGPRGWKNQGILTHPAHERYGKDIIMAGYVNRQDLAVLYKNALVFVYPSLYEGFGMPPLEALNAGVPVIVGRNSSLPEVLGDAPFYVSPIPHATEIASAVQYIMNHPQETGEHVLKGRQQAQKYSWSRTALETLQVYEDVVRGYRT